MEGHIHIGLWQLVAGFIGVLLIGIPWRIVSLWLRDSRIGQAMAFAY